MHKPFPSFTALILISLASFFFATAAGSVSFTFSEIINTFTDPEPTMAHTIIWEIRIPRAYVAYITGSLLALAGLLMQVLLRNPLADPYILGVSGGAAVTALTAMAIGLAGIWLPVSAFSGAIITMFIVFGLSHGKGSWNPGRLLLTGVVIAAGWGAMINFILSIAPDKPLRGMLFWLMGDIGEAHTGIASLLILLLGMSIALILARSLNILARGELQASALGVSVKKLRIIIFFVASGLTAVAVTEAGSIGFVGLIVPHILRLVIGSDHRFLIPASVLAGGSLVLLSDTLARSIIAPNQLPVGVITAFIGVPLFLFLLNRNYQWTADK